MSLPQKNNINRDHPANFGRAQIRANLAMSQGHTWMPNFDLPFESSLSLLRKFSSLNCLSLRDSINLLFSGAEEIQPQFAYKFDFNLLFTGHWEEKGSTEIAKAIFHAGLDQWAGKLAWILCCRSFRYCAPCLAEGYHCKFMQLSTLLKCPLHKSPLLDHCAHCEKQLPEGNISWDESVGLFNCPFCKNFLGAPFRGTYSDDYSRRCGASWLGVAQWTQALKLFGLGPTGYHFFGSTAAKTFAILVKLSPMKEEVESLFNPIVSETLEFGEFVPAILPSSWREPGPYGQPSSQELLALPIYRSIRRKLLASIKERHSDCMNDLVSKNREIKWTYRVDPYECILCRAFVLWRMRCEQIPMVIENSSDVVSHSQCRFRRGLLDNWPSLDHLGASFLNKLFYAIFYRTLEVLEAFIKESFQNPLNHPIPSPLEFSRTPFLDVFDIQCRTHLMIETAEITCRRNGQTRATIAFLHPGPGRFKVLKNLSH